MIDHIKKISWTQKDGKMGYCFHVFYKPTRRGRKGIHRMFSFNDELPNSVLMYILEAAECKTTYTHKNKIEIYNK